MGNKPSSSGVCTHDGGFQRQLLAMDFDHTIIDSNTDVEVQDLAEDGVIPSELRAQYSSKCWNDFMQGVFALLHKQGCSITLMQQYVQRLPMAPGMCELLDAAGFDDKTDVIVISDSNTLFIEWILQKRGFRTAVDEIFSNPAHVDEGGCLQIRYYHKNDWCKLSTDNMCKGQILEDYVKKRHKQDTVNYKRVVYVGDGMNDLCPGLRLRECDMLCARKGFKLDRALEERRPTSLKCQVHRYTSGVEVADILNLSVTKGEAVGVPSYIAPDVTR